MIVKTNIKKHSKILESCFCIDNVDVSIFPIFIYRCLDCSAFWSENVLFHCPVCGSIDIVREVFFDVEYKK